MININYFQNGAAYTVEMAGKILDRSSNYVEGKLTGIKYEATIASEAGPEARAWSGNTLNALVAQGKITKKVPAGTINWLTKKPAEAVDHVDQIVIK